MAYQWLHWLDPCWDDPCHDRDPQSPSQWITESGRPNNQAISERVSAVAVDSGVFWLFSTICSLDFRPIGNSHFCSKNIMCSGVFSAEWKHVFFVALYESTFSRICRPPWHFCFNVWSHTFQCITWENAYVCVCACVWFFNEAQTGPGGPPGSVLLRPEVPHLSPWLRRFQKTEKHKHKNHFNGKWR